MKNGDAGIFPVYYSLNIVKNSEGVSPDCQSTAITTVVTGSYYCTVCWPKLPRLQKHKSAVNTKKNDAVYKAYICSLTNLCPSEAKKPKAVVVAESLLEQVSRM